MAIELPDTAVRDLFRRQAAGFAPRSPIRQGQAPSEGGPLPPFRGAARPSGAKARVQVYVSLDEYRQVIASRGSYPSYSAYIEDALAGHMRAAGGDAAALFSGRRPAGDRRCLNLRLSAASVASMRSCIQGALMSPRAKGAAISISGLIRAAIQADMSAGGLRGAERGG